MSVERPWEALSAELDLWAAAGRTATFWWRDDDAVDATPALDCLADAAAGLTVGLAVIPEPATEALAARAEAGNFAILQHGLRHGNHAPAGEKKAEFGAHRPVAVMLAELAEGRRLLSARFAARPLPIVVPPWNRISPELIPLLAAHGFPTLSTFAGRIRPPPGLALLDCHCDPVDWHGGRGFVGDAAALAPVLHHLRARRLGEVPDRPTGLLTHHLAMDEATWSFCTTFRNRTALNTSARWLSPGDAARPIEHEAADAARKPE